MLGLMDSNLGKKSACGDLDRKQQPIRGKLSSTFTVGRFTLKQIANLDQTPLAFSFTSDGTYADTGDRTGVG